MKVKCPCCDGTGKIEERAPVPLSPLQFKVYDIIRKAKYGITGPALVNMVYADRADGGPDWASVSVHVMIKRINGKLKPYGQRLGATNRGIGGIFRLEHLNA